LVYFHECSESSAVYRLGGIGKGKHTVVVIVRKGPGFPLVCKGSHITHEGSGGISLPVEEIPQQEGLVVVFDASMAIQDPEVKGTGGSGILLLY
jgi:hypothetical protein